MQQNENQAERDVKALAEERLESLVITPNNFYSTEDLKEFARLIIEKIISAEIVIASQGSFESSGKNMGDQGADNEAREVRAREKKAQEDFKDNLEAALRRIANGLYGICKTSKFKIPVARLKVQLVATEIIEIKEKIWVKKVTNTETGEWQIVEAKTGKVITSND